MRVWALAFGLAVAGCHAAPAPAAPAPETALTMLLRGERLEGPFARFPEDVCHALAKGRNRCEPKSAWSDDVPLERHRLVVHGDAKAGAILEARLFRIKTYLTDARMNWKAFALAIRTRKGWFASVDDPYEDGPPMDEAGLEAPVASMSLERAGEKPLLVLDSTLLRQIGAPHEEPDTHRRIESVATFKTRYVTFCAVGASDVPSCSRIIVGCGDDGEWIQTKPFRSETRISTEWRSSRRPYCSRGDELDIGKFVLVFP